MLWVALVADSGLGKSPALNKAREPIDQLQIDAQDKYSREMTQYEVADAEYQKYLKSSRKKSDSSLSAPEKPVKPVMIRFSVSDSTTEALLPILSDNPYGVCLIRDELAAFFGGMNAYRSGKVDVQVYIEIHGGYFVQSDRKTTGYVSAKTPSLSIIGGIQSDVIFQRIKDEPEFLTTGFGARFLMIYPPTDPICWNDREVNSTVQETYKELIDALLQYRKHYTPDEPGIVTFTQEAKTLIFDFQNQHAIDSVRIDDGNVRYVENKAGMHAARLCLNLHVIKCIENGI
jgi:hypothetical protein